MGGTAWGVRLGSVLIILTRDVRWRISTTTEISPRGRPSEALATRGIGDSFDLFLSTGYRLADCASVNLRLKTIATVSIWRHPWDELTSFFHEHLR